MQELAAPKKLNLHPWQVDAMFTLTVGPEQNKRTLLYPANDSGNVQIFVKGRRSGLSSQKALHDQHRVCLYLAYHLISSSEGNTSDKRVIWKLKQFNMPSEAIVCALKGLESIFECVNSFYYKNNKSVKRYNVENKDQVLIKEWCDWYSKANPEVALLKDRL
ncbi:hypothetical protein BN7874_091 [Phage NCTB]|nr:hypothetical protein BN7874_091 [Phage NCTB]